jgi:kinesin family member C2/C3
MSAVISCLLALRDRFGSHVGEGFHYSFEEKGRMHSMEFPIWENGHGSRNSESVEESKKMKSKLLKVPKSSATSGEFLYQRFPLGQFLKKLQW